MKVILKAKLAKEMISFIFLNIEDVKISFFGLTEQNKQCMLQIEPRLLLISVGFQLYGSNDELIYPENDGCIVAALIEPFM